MAEQTSGAKAGTARSTSTKTGGDLTFLQVRAVREPLEPSCLTFLQVRAVGEPLEPCDLTLLQGGALDRPSRAREPLEGD